jgi:hypothetical protein
MDLWDQGKFTALVDDTEDEVRSRHGTHPAPDAESVARSYNSKVLGGRLRTAVRSLTQRGQGGVLQPDDTCSKTGKPVLEVLRGKHPAMRDPQPDMEDDARGSFEHYDEVPEAVPLVITGDVVEKVASRLSGGAGPGGSDAVDLRNWLLRFGAESEALRDALAGICEMMANGNPSWAAFRALMACRLVALDKCPGVRPVGIGEIYRRLFAKCVLEVAGDRATMAAGNLNLCAGLPAGIEGAVHAVRAAMADPSPPAAAAAAAAAVELLTQPQAETVMDDESSDDAEGEEEDPAAALLVDATNGFNELGRRAMLFTVRHRWAPGARFAFNCYRHSAMLILRRKGRPGYTLLSEEGVTQGDPLSMLLYGLALVPLAETLRAAFPDVLQAWYADDSVLQGKTSGIASCMAELKRLGPARGYLPEPAKSILICAPADRPAAETRLEAFGFNYTEGNRYVGGFLGTEEALSQWLEPKIQQWVSGVESLAQVAKRYPQTAYAGLAMSLQQEWQYLQRVVPGCGAAFQPIEDALRDVFIPALLQGDPAETQREQTSLAVRHAGLGIPDPTSTAEANYSTSVACARLLTRSLRAGRNLDAHQHSAHAGLERRKASKTKVAAEELALSFLAADAGPMAKRRLLRVKETGTWLTTTPDRLNGTELSAEEFRDSLRLRLGLPLLDLPDRCDGCGQKFSVGHAMSCKKGGLVLLRHNDVAAEWHHLCAQALTPSAVSDEPLIHSGRDSTVGVGTPDAVILQETRGDVAVHGFWKRGATAVFDIRVTDTDAPTYRGQAPRKVLAKQEKEKKDKYVEHCLARRRHFTPLVFSVDGLRGIEAEAAVKRLASRLAAKWKRTYSEVCGYVRSRLALTLVRTTSLCLRGARDPTARATHAVWDSGTGLALYR